MNGILASMESSHTPGSLSVEDYRDRLMSTLSRASWPRPEHIIVEAALGRVLAADASARLAIPRASSSDADGFGITYPDGPMPLAWTVAADAVPGQAPIATPGPGETVRVTGGAPLPAGVDTVIPLADAVADGDTVLFTGGILPGQHVRAAGRDVAVGDVLAAAGTKLDGRHIGALVAAGVDAAEIARKPQVAIVTPTGDLAGSALLPGQALAGDSDGPYVAAAVAAAGGGVSARTRVRDTPDALQKAFNDAVRTADLILVTGGCGDDRDAMRTVLSGYGGEFATIAAHPCHAMGHARVIGVPVVVLPDDPLGVAVAFACFVRPMLAAMLGLADPPAVWGVVTRGWHSPVGQREFMPVAVTPRDDGTLAVAPVADGDPGSQTVASLARADAFAVVGDEATDVREGDVVRLLAVL